jgi:Ala-tRNA(Pro) deacylase
MFFVSEIQHQAPSSFHTPLQKETYEALAKLSIPFERVDTDEAITMEDCVPIDERLSMKMVKTLLLCNRQQTEFYLFVTAGAKPFASKAFSQALGIARVSFAPKEMLETKLGTPIGACTVFSLLRKEAAGVTLVIDADVLKEPFYGCSDGTTTGYLKIKTDELLNVFLPSTGHQPLIISVPASA